MKKFLATLAIVLVAVSCAWAGNGEKFTISAGIGHVDSHLACLVSTTEIKNVDIEFYDIFGELSLSADNVEVFCLGGLMAPKTIAGVDIDTFNALHSWTEMTAEGPEQKNPEVIGVEAKAGAGLRLQLGDADIAIDGYGGVMIFVDNEKALDLYTDTTVKFSLIGARAKLSLHLLPFAHIWATVAADYYMESQVKSTSYYENGVQYPTVELKLNDDSGHSYKYGFGVSLYL